MNKITSNQYYGIGQVIMKVMQKKNIERVNIYENSEFRSEIKIFGINWSAIGTVDIETTNKFINDLQEATKIVEYINKKEYSIDYDDENEEYMEFLKNLENELMNL